MSDRQQSTRADHGRIEPADRKSYCWQCSILVSSFPSNFCSTDCRKLYESIQKKNRVCRTCRQPLSSYQRAYCSNPCQRNYHSYLSRKKNKSNLFSSKKYVIALCPYCGIKHKYYVFWTGRGIPRKFCKECSKSASYTVAEIEHADRSTGKLYHNPLL